MDLYDTLHELIRSFSHLATLASRHGDALGPAVASGGVCFVVVLLSAVVVRCGKRIGFRFDGRPALGGVIAFALGIVTTALTLASLVRLAPDTTRDALKGLWWPCLLGCLLLFAPSLAWCLIRVRSLARYVPSAIDGRIGSSLGLGVSAAMGLPILATPPPTAWISSVADRLPIPQPWTVEQLEQATGWFAFVAASAGASLISGLIGRAIRERSVRRALLLICACVLAGVWGLGIGLLHVGLILLTVVAAAIIAAVSYRSNAESTRLLADPRPSNAAPNELPFHETVDFRQLVTRLAGRWKSQRSCWLRISGPAGCGKTATSDELVKRLTESDGDNVRVLRLSCRADNTPLEPFLRMAGDLAPDLLADAAGVALLNSTWEMLATLVPTLNKLAGDSPEQQSPADWIPLVVSELGSMAQRQRLILVVDDAQWIDESSVEVLRRLRTRFTDERGPFVICAIDRQNPVLPDTMFDETFALEPPTDQHLKMILVKGLCFNERSARRIIESIDAGHAANQRSRNLVWLQRTVDHLSELGAIFQKDGERCLVPKYLSKQLPPAPRGLEELVRERVEQFDRHRLLLQAAACIGCQFHVDDLSCRLQRDRLLVLEALSEITHRRDLVVEVDETGSFQFVSAQTYQIVCNVLGIAGMPGGSVSQLQREIHARIASALQVGDKRDVFDLARHCALAGGTFAEDGLRYCQQAAAVATAAYAFEKAEQYLRWAGRCAKSCNRAFDIQLQQLLLDCERAHVTQEEQLLCDAADRAIAATRNHDTIPFLLKCARACYDAHKVKGGATQRYATEAVRIGFQVTEAEAVTPAQRADGYHFIALGQSPSPASRARLRQARELLLDSENPTELITLARIECSLAGDLTNSVDWQSNADEARQLYEHSLVLRQQHRPNDLAGIARCHGGLARVALFIVGDAETARRHAEQSLECSRQMGDLRGMAQMTSLLGLCALDTGDRPRAARHYEKSAKYAQSRGDQLFAIIGLLRSAQGTLDDMHQHGSKLLSLVRGDDGPAVFIPSIAKPHLAEALEISRQRARSNWVDALNAYLGRDLIRPRRASQTPAA